MCKKMIDEIKEFFEWLWWAKGKLTVLFLPIVILVLVFPVTSKADNPILNLYLTFAGIVVWFGILGYVLIKYNLWE